MRNKNRVGRRILASLLTFCVLAACQASLIGLTVRDYGGNHVATNRIWFYRELDGSPKPTGDGIYPPVEWDSNRPENFPVAATRGQTLTLSLRFYNPQFFPQSGTFIVDGARFRVAKKHFSDPDELVPLTVTSGVPVNLPEEESTVISVTVSGLPNYVCLGTIEIDARVQGTLLLWNTGGYAVWETVYLTDSAPTGMQDQVWTDLLGNACMWAKGAVGATQTRNEATKGMYFALRWVYSPYGNEYYKAHQEDNTKATYLLKEALESAAFAEMDCRDTSGMLFLAMEALGHDTDITWIDCLEPVKFVTNPLCPMGSNPAFNVNFVPNEFNFHQIATQSTNVWDATTAHLVDLYGFGYRNPPLGWT